MNRTDAKQVMSRLADDEFFDREAELERVLSLARRRHGGCSLRDEGEGVVDASATQPTLREARRARRATNALLLGAPRVGKSELLRKAFDCLFSDGADAAPIYYSLKSYCLDEERLARDLFAQFLAQFIAFRRHDARLIESAGEPLAAITRAAPPDDYIWVRAMVDGFNGAAETGDASLILRSALQAPAIAAARTQLSPFVMLDNFHLLAASPMVRAELVRALTAEQSGAAAPAYLLSGLRRVMTTLMPPDEELYRRLELIRIEAMDDESVEKLIRAMAASLEVEVSDSTVELMIQQLNRDLFYIHAVLDAAASRRARLRTFMEFERVYTDEVLSGRINHYLSALLRDIAPNSRQQRAALEALNLTLESSEAVPIDAVIERMGESAAEAESLLAQLHTREFLEISYGFLRAASDTVLADFVRTKYRNEIAGARRPVAGEALLSEKLKHSYRLMMSRYNRAVESQLVEMLSRFDFQSVPASLFDLSQFDRHYRGMSRVQVRRALDDEQERMRLPQMVLVNDAGAGEQPGVNWRLFAASGFEGGIYSEANEVVWLIALINSKEPLDVETLNRIDQRLEAAVRLTPEKNITPRLVRWYVSKEGFSAVAAERLSALRAHRSTFAQLDLIEDCLVKLATGMHARPASEFELVIPIEEDAELIAARTVEQVARAAEFDQEAINQIKTALIEACINAAEHGDSPDRRIYQRFAIDGDRLIITVSNKGKTFGASVASTPSMPPASAAQRRGRGLQIIRALMDEVRFERADDGASLVMVKYLKRPEE
ncbi:MAG TPA: ATP-binding protein [Blastocatellia bacterium]|nr:ATP-binding protein [Blastocatellia bacterium]